MNEVNQKLKLIRPNLKDIAPQSYWMSILFGIFNTVVGLSLFFSIFSINFGFIGYISTQVWGFLFLIHGILLVGFTLSNNWKYTKIMHLLGIAIKTSWWLQLVSTLVSLDSLDNLAKMLIAFIYVWTLLISLQLTTYRFFTPRLDDAQ